MSNQHVLLEVTTAKLIGELISHRLSQLHSEQVGLIAASLPPFDVPILIESLQSALRDISLAFLGYDQDLIPNGIATDVETVIAWRNDTALNKPIVVVMNGAKPQDKTHSLEMLEPITDDDLRQTIIKQARSESLPSSPAEKLWEELDRVRTQRILPLVARQVAELYTELQTKEVEYALPIIGLLPDPQLDKYTSESSRFFARLKENRNQMNWLNELDGRDFRNLARTLEHGSSNHKSTFRKIHRYVQVPDRDTLAFLTLQEVIDIREAKKAPTVRKTNKIRQPGPQATLAPLVDQLIMLDPDSDRDELEKLEFQADRISDMFQENLLANYLDDVAAVRERDRYKLDEDEEDVLAEAFIDARTQEEISKVERPRDRQKQHPVDDYMPVWVHPECWGGQYVVNKVDPNVKTIAAWLDDDSKDDEESQFIPLNPMDVTKRDAQKGISLINLAIALDKLSGESISLEKLLRTLHEKRALLARYRSLFLYYPDQAAISQILGPVVKAYIDTYYEFAMQLQTVCQNLSTDNPDATQRTLAQFLALDSVIISVETDSLLPEKSVILTPLHPLHLWKWYALIDIVKDATDIPYDGFEERLRNLISRKIEADLPTLLNTFLLHEHMFAPRQTIVDDRLIYAGEINNITSNVTVGIPYYVPEVFQSSTNDGLEEFVASIARLLAFYPPARIGLSFVLIDPPASLTPLLLGLYDLYEDDKLDGAKIHIYYTHEKKAEFNEWRAKDEPVLRLIRDNPHWEFHRHLQPLDYDEILESIRGQSHSNRLSGQHDQKHLYPHIVLVCDPSQLAVTQSTFRQYQEDSHPFGVPVQLTYDNITDEVKFVSTPAGGLFSAYDNVRSTLNGELRLKVMSVGTISVEPRKLQGFFTKGIEANWLAILDYPQGTIQLPPTIGRRLTHQNAGTRTLAIHTNEYDWQHYWRDRLQQKLRILGLDGVVDPDVLLKLFPVLREGLLRLIRISDEDASDPYDPIDIDVLQPLLGLVATLNWVRQKHPGAALIRLDDEFGDWYVTRELPDYAAFWLDVEDGLHIDLMTVRSEDSHYRDLKHTLVDARENLKPLVEFANVLLYAMKDENLTGPLFRASLRERLTAAVFTTFESDTSGLLGQSKSVKKAWEATINGLHLPKYTPHVGLLNINVALRETEDEADTSQIFLIEGSGFSGMDVKIPRKYLNWEATVVESPESIKVLEKLPTDVEQGSQLIEEQRLESGAESSPLTYENEEIEEPAGSDEFEETKEIPEEVQQQITQQINNQATELRKALMDYGIAISEVNVAKTQVGPRFIRYWVKLQPPAGRLSEMLKYAEDIARELGSKTIPIIANIPGERYVGVDLARKTPVSVSLEEGLSALPANDLNQLALPVGEDVAGNAIQLDLATLPHMLVAGQTGSGKTVFLSSLITGLVWQHPPEYMHLILVDPKQTDFSIFSRLPHLQERGIILEPEEAINALQNLLAVETPERRELLSAARCPNILEYNRRNQTELMPWIVVVIDEFADLILSLSRQQRAEFERQVNRLAATGRNVGIRLIIATQRPTIDVITGTIKTNIPVRVSFRLPSQIDSRTILDRPGAENLLGKGDMLLLHNSAIQRLQGYYATFEEFFDLLKQAGY